MLDGEFFSLLGIAGDIFWYQSLIDSAGSSWAGTYAGVPPDFRDLFDAATARLEANPNDVDARFQRALACREIGCHAEALADFSEVIRLQPEHARAWILCSEILDMLGKHDSARQARQRALELDPSLA